MELRFSHAWPKNRNNMLHWRRIVQRYQRMPPVRLAIGAVLILLLILLMLQSVSTNQVETTAIDHEMVIKVSLDRLSDKISFFHYESDLDYEQRVIKKDAGLIADIRWPRVVMAGLVGISLALAGATLQGVLRNPLADPGLIGVSSGAAVGAITAILLKANFSGLLTLFPAFAGIDPETLSGPRFAQTIFAFAAGLLTTILVYQLSRTGGRVETTNLLLIGLAVNSIAGAYVGLATYIADEAQSTDIIFWSLGSVAGLEWADVYLVIPFVVAGIVILPIFARPLNIMTLGEAEAQSLGVNTERLRRVTIAVSALMVGVAVGFAGIISFVGLVIPHLMRLLFGPDHRMVLPGSAIGGAIFLIAADMFGRTLPGPSNIGFTIEVPVGILTALVGGPFFLFLILMRRKMQ